MHTQGASAKLILNRTGASEPLRVLVVSHRALVRAGLLALLQQPSVEARGAMDVSPNREWESHVVLWDVAGDELRVFPFRGVALLARVEQARAWLDAGAQGCLLEDASPEELVSALRQVARGEVYLSLPIAQHLASTAAHAAPKPSDAEPLTEREREVLHLLAGGLSNKEIAQKLYLSVRTVEGHLANIYGKLHLERIPN